MKDGPSRRSAARAGRALENVRRLGLRARYERDPAKVISLVPLLERRLQTIETAAEEIRERAAKQRKSREKHAHWLEKVERARAEAGLWSQRILKRHEWRWRVQAADILVSRYRRMPLVAWTSYAVTDRARKAHPPGETEFAPRVELQARGPKDPTSLLWETDGAKTLVLKLGEELQTVVERVPSLRGRVRFSVQAEPDEILLEYMKSPRLLSGSRPELGWAKSVSRSGVFVPRWYDLRRSLPAAMTQSTNRIASLMHAGVNITMVILDVNFGAFGKRKPKGK